MSHVRLAEPPRSPMPSRYGGPKQACSSCRNAETEGNLAHIPCHKTRTLRWRVEVTLPPKRDELAIHNVMCEVQHVETWKIEGSQFEDSWTFLQTLQTARRHGSPEGIVCPHRASQGLTNRTRENADGEIIHDRTVSTRQIAGTSLLPGKWERRP